MKKLHSFISFLSMAVLFFFSSFILALDTTEVIETGSGIVADELGTIATGSANLGVDIIQTGIQLLIYPFKTILDIILG